MLFLVAARNNFNVVLKHLPGKTNGITDALSRKQYDSVFFYSLAPQADRIPLGLRASFNCTAAGTASDLRCRVYLIHIQCLCEQVLRFLPLLRSVATPAKKEMLVFFAVALSRSMASSSIQVYIAAVGNLYCQMGYRVPMHNNPRLRLRGAKWAPIVPENQSRAGSSRNH